MEHWELDSSGGTLASGTWASKPLGYLGPFLSGSLCSPPELLSGEPRRTGGPNWGSLHGDIENLMTLRLVKDLAFSSKTR